MERFLHLARARQRGMVGTQDRVIGIQHLVFFVFGFWLLALGSWRVVVLGFAVCTRQRFSLGSSVLVVY